MFYYRTNGSTGAYTSTTLLRPNASQPFVWDAASFGAATLDYYYTLYSECVASFRHP